MAEHRARHWIGGEWAGTGPEKDSISPATGAVIGSFHDGGIEAAQSPIDAAAAAFRREGWASDVMLRSTALSHLADAYTKRMDEIVDTLCLENGELRYEAGFEANFIVRALRFAAGLALHTFGRVLDPRPGVQSMSIRQPVGVAGIVTPWNSPASLSIRSLARRSRPAAPRW